MKYILLLSSLFFSSGPQVGDWICFVTSAKDKSCGTYGYSKSKKVATVKAFGLCQEECSSNCFLDYCEIVE